MLGQNWDRDGVTELQDYRFAIIELYKIKSKILDSLIESKYIKEPMLSVLKVSQPDGS